MEIKVSAVGTGDDGPLSAAFSDAIFGLQIGDTGNDASARSENHKCTIRIMVSKVGGNGPNIQRTPRKAR
jgi:hypothetical protein